MKNKEFEKQIQSSFNKITPDVLDNILQECEVQNHMSNVKENKAQPRGFKHYAVAFMTCFVFVACIGLFFFNKPALSIVTLDVNPGIEIHLNDDNTIDEVLAINDDANIVLAGLDLNNKDINVGLESILDSMLEKGYLSKDKNSILLSIDCEDANYAKLKANLSMSIDNYLKAKNIDVALVSQAIISEDVNDLLEDQELTLGKAQLIDKLIVANPKLDVDDLAKMNINDLNLLLSNPKLVVADIETTGEASESLYVGRAEAKRIALNSFNLNETDLKDLEVELDYEDGQMVYEVEFELDGKEYEILVNATDGSLVETSIEVDDDDDDDDDDIIVEDDYLAKDEVLNLVLNHANFTQEQIHDLKIELENEDGIVIYEVEFKADIYEYEYEVNALSGDILKHDQEIDD